MISIESRDGAYVARPVHGIHNEFRRALASKNHSIFFRIPKIPKITYYYIDTRSCTELQGRDACSTYVYCTPSVLSICVYMPIVATPLIIISARRP